MTRDFHLQYISYVIISFLGIFECFAYLIFGTCFPVGVQICIVRRYTQSIAGAHPCRCFGFGADGILARGVASFSGPQRFDEFFRAYSNVEVARQTLEKKSGAKLSWAAAPGRERPLAENLVKSSGHNFVQSSKLWRVHWMIQRSFRSLL